MARFIFVLFGTTGDLHPGLALAGALKQRGHRCSFLINRQHQAGVERQGHEFFPLGGDEILPFPGTSEVPNVVAMGRATRQVYHYLEELYEPGDTVAVAPMHLFGARLAQEKLGLPLAQIYLDPNGLPYNKGWLQRWRARRRVRALAPLVMPEVCAFREQLDLPPPRPGWEHSPLSVLALFPRWWLPDYYIWPQHTVFCGWPLWLGKEDQLDEETEAFLAAGEPPVVFTLGSFSISLPQLADQAVEVCQNLGIRGIVLGGRPQGALPSGVFHRPFLPFAALFPRAAAVVHHAGAGTTAECLLAGVPQLAINLGGQPMSGHLHAEFGVGRYIKRCPPRTSDLTRALVQVLTSAEVRERCQEYSKKMTRLAGREMAADQLEPLVGSDQ